MSQDPSCIEVNLQSSDKKVPQNTPFGRRVSLRLVGGLVHRVRSRKERTGDIPSSESLSILSTRISAPQKASEHREQTPRKLDRREPGIKPTTGATSALTKDPKRARPFIDPGRSSLSCISAAIIGVGTIAAAFGSPGRYKAASRRKIKLPYFSDDVGRNGEEIRQATKSARLSIERSSGDLNYGVLYPLGPMSKLCEHIQRSVSSPTSVGASYTEVEKETDMPKRSVSDSDTLPGPVELLEILDGPCALNGVSLYYKRKTQQLVFDMVKGMPIQLSNSKKIRKSATNLSKKSTARSRYTVSRNPSRSRTIKLNGVPSHLPFSNLLRSTSLGNSALHQSLIRLHDTREVLRASEAHQYRFRAGKVSVSKSEILLRIAYPHLKCAFCPRQFKGQFRKRNRARHIRRIHGRTTSNREPRASGYNTLSPRSSEKNM